MPFFESRILPLNGESTLASAVASFLVVKYWAFVFQFVIKLKAKLERR